MSEGRRASVEQRARRVNAAAELLGAGVGAPEATRRIAGRFGLSERQAHRYVDRARRQGPVAVPEPTVVLSVRLPATVADRLRRHALASGGTASGLAAQAIAELLDRARPRLGDG